MLSFMKCRFRETGLERIASGVIVVCLERLDVLGFGDYVKNLSCHSDRAWFFGILEMLAALI